MAKLRENVYNAVLSKQALLCKKNGYNYNP